MPISTPPVAVCWVSALTARASPKSATLTRPSSASSTFSGFTSRWIRPAACAAASAESTGSSRVSALAGCHRRVLADQVAQGVPGDVLHRQEQGAVVVALVEDADHVRVREPGCGPGLADEPGGEVVVVAEPGVHDLDRADPVQAQVDGLVDGGHPAAGDARTDAVAAVEHAPDQRVRDSPVHDGSPPDGRPGGGKSRATAADFRRDGGHSSPRPGRLASLGVAGGTRSGGDPAPGDLLLQRQHVGDVPLGGGVHPVPCGRRPAPGSSRRRRSSGCASDRRIRISRRPGDVVVELSRVAAVGRRAGRSTRPVPGMICIAPSAPAVETRRCCQPDSCQAIASARCGSTSWRWALATITRRTCGTARRRAGASRGSRFGSGLRLRLGLGLAGLSLLRPASSASCRVSCWPASRACAPRSLDRCGGARAARSARCGSDDHGNPDDLTDVERAPVHPDQLVGPGVVAHRDRARGVTGADPVALDHPLRVRLPDAAPGRRRRALVRRPRRRPAGALRGGGRRTGGRGGNQHQARGRWSRW